MSTLPKDINRLVGQALHTYEMLSHGDRVIVAVSGGVDSLVLAWLLLFWRKKAPISYDLLAIHLDMGFEGSDTKAIAAQMQAIGIPYIIEHTTYGKTAYDADPKNVCFNCARKRRNHLFDIAREKNFSAIALGHHKDDIIETFFLNMLYSGNISTMLPHQKLFKDSLKIIRPMAYLTKQQIEEIAAIQKITPVKNPCPVSEETKRVSVRKLLSDLYDHNASFKNNIFASLANVRLPYLLK